MECHQVVTEFAQITAQVDEHTLGPAVTIGVDELRDSHGPSRWYWPQPATCDFASRRARDLLFSKPRIDDGAVCAPLLPLPGLCHAGGWRLAEARKTPHQL